jgi:rhamnulokinase
MASIKELTESYGLPYLAFDLGAGNGRAILGFFGKNNIELFEIHRFGNSPVWMGGILYWDILYLWKNILEALKKCSHAGVTKLAGIGIDSWNLDFGLIGPGGVLLGNPISYRDQGGESILPVLKEAIDEFSLYEKTGIGYTGITALSRFIESREKGKGGLLEFAETYLPISDLLRYFLTGQRGAEETILWGSQLINLQSRVWDRELIECFDIPEHILPDSIKAGTAIGNVQTEIIELTGIKSSPVIAVAGHDTISATIPVSDFGEETVLVSIGTWTIIGQLKKEPIVNRNTFEKSFYNEIGAESIFFARNLMGFYVLENLIDCWRLCGIDCSYENILEQASLCPSFEIIIDVNDPSFFSSLNMVSTLQAYLRNTAQKYIDDIGVISRALFEGLAYSIRESIHLLSEVSAKKMEEIVVTGGGVKNGLLCQMIADAAGVPVITGPAEATVIGNLALQAVAEGRFQGIDDFCRVMGTSYRGTKFLPQKNISWDEYSRRRSEK